MATSTIIRCPNYSFLFPQMNTGKLILPDGVVALGTSRHFIGIRTWALYQKSPVVMTLEYGEVGIRRSRRKYEVAIPYLLFVLDLGNIPDYARVFVSNKSLRSFNDPYKPATCFPNVDLTGEACWKERRASGVANKIYSLEKAIFSSSFNDDMGYDRKDLEVWERKTKSNPTKARDWVVNDLLKHENIYTVEELL